MQTVRLRAKSNPGLVAMSNAHPNATFEVRGAWPVGDHLRLLVQTADVETNVLGETLDAIASVREVRRRSASDGIARYEIETTLPAPHGSTADSGIVPAFPQTVEAGWVVGDLTAPGARLRAFRDELADAGIEYRVEYVRSARTDEAVGPLTDRQREAVELAVELGYYDTPRACTLTEVAAALDVDTSVASRLLHRAEGEIVAAHLGQATESPTANR